MIRMYSGCRSTSARAVTISETYKPPPYWRHRRRKALFVIPAIGASTTGTSMERLPIVCGDICIDVADGFGRSEEHTSELQSRGRVVCRLRLDQENVTIRSGPAGASVACSATAVV